MPKRINMEGYVDRKMLIFGIIFDNIIHLQMGGQPSGKLECSTKSTENRYAS